MIEAFDKYSAAGFLCLPTKKDKSPQNSTSWNNGFSRDNFEKAYGVGVICGEKSGGLECLDFDNHFDDAEKILKEYLRQPEVLAIYKKYSLPIESTVGGGYHLLFRCHKNEGNRKLAQRLNKRNNPEAIIESRGEGGYFVAAPTPGYEVIRNDIFNVAIITEEERDILIYAALSMNEYFKPIFTEYENKSADPDIYINYEDAVNEMKRVLVENKWTEFGVRWRRPYKTEGISATLGVVGSNIFFVFTSNAAPFEPNHAYTPFQVLALLKYSGDFKAAAEELLKSRKKKKNALSEAELLSIITSSKIDTSKQISEPPTILSVVERGASQLEYKRMLTLGNFSVIIGKAKTKKTFLLTMLASAVISNKIPKFDSKMSSYGKKDVMWFDTEQGEYDSFNCIKRVERMSGDISNLRAFNLRPYSPEERCQIIEYAMRSWGDSSGLVVIDGIADLANGINDEDEASRVSTMLLRLTKVHNCHMSIVIHQNKNDNFATGHLGSSLMKKAEIIVSVSKNQHNKYVTDVNCDMSRGIDFEPFSFDVVDGIPKVCDAVPIPEKSFFKEEDAPF